MTMWNGVGPRFTRGILNLSHQPFLRIPNTPHAFQRLGNDSDALGSRPEIITQDCAGFWFAYKAHPPMNIGICVVGCNVVDEPKDKHDG